MTTTIPTTRKTGIQAGRSPARAKRDDRPERADRDPGAKVVRVKRPPEAQACPVILASPHSGREYDAELSASTRLSVDLLRRSEDAYVDQLIDFAPEYGATLVCAEFPRVFVDVNRAAGEVDPGMFADRIPVGEIAPSRRALSGLGVIPRIGAEGRTLYRRRMRFAEARARLERYYHPYHGALQAEMARLKARFGCAVLVDMHSMPASSAGGADIVLGDRFGTSCNGLVTERMETILRELGFVTVRNNPYAGGYTTEHYGRPPDAVHAIQVEINRALYMDENRVTLTTDHTSLITKIRSFVSELTGIDWSQSLQS